MEMFYIAVIVSCMILLMVLFFWVIMMLQASKSVFQSQSSECPNGYVVKPGLVVDGKTRYSCRIPVSQQQKYASGVSMFSFNSGNSNAKLGYETNTTSSGSEPTINFNDDMWLGKTGACNKTQWATQNGVFWDGLTNSQASACRV